MRARPHGFLIRAVGMGNVDKKWLGLRREGRMPLMGGLAPLVSALFCVSLVWNAKGNRVRQDSDSIQCRLLSVTPFKDPPIYQYIFE